MTKGITFDEVLLHRCYISDNVTRPKLVSNGKKKKKKKEIVKNRYLYCIMFLTISLVIIFFFLNKNVRRVHQFQAKFSSNSSPNDDE